MRKYSLRSRRSTYQDAGTAPGCMHALLRQMQADQSPLLEVDGIPHGHRAFWGYRMQQYWSLDTQL